MITAYELRKELVHFNKDFCDSFVNTTLLKAKEQNVKRPNMKVIRVVVGYVGIDEDYGTCIINGDTAISNEEYAYIIKVLNGHGFYVEEYFQGETMETGFDLCW